MAVAVLQWFANSTFNKCPHQPLPEMDGPPLEIHVDPSVKPKVANKAAPVALHWKTEVFDDMIRDKVLDVIE